MERGMLKWAPFSSVVTAEEILSEIEHKKNRIAKPILSSDKLDELNQKVIGYFYTKDTINLIYYKNSHYYKITGTIKRIDPIFKIIYVNNIKIHVGQIINIYK